MAFPLLQVLSQAISLAGQDQGKTQRSDIGNKDQYFQYLMSMMNPNYNANSSRRGQTISGSDDSGGLLNLVSLLGGKENIGSEYSSGYDTGYNSEFYQPENWGTW